MEGRFAIGFPARETVAALERIGGGRRLGGAKRYENGMKCRQPPVRVRVASPGVRRTVSA
jgi:hypothetical protein